MATAPASKGAPEGRDVHERGIWRAAFVLYDLALLAVPLALGGALVLAAVVLSQGTLLGLLLVPGEAWLIGSLVVAALHAVHDQDLTTDIRPLRRLLAGLRQGHRQAAVLWIPVGLMAAGLIGGGMIGGGAGPDLAGLVLLLAVALIALLGSVIASRFTVSGIGLWRAALGAVAVSPRGVLGVGLTLMAAVLSVAVLGEWVLLLVAAPLVLLLDRSARPLVLTLEESLDDR
ncbi:hypothetical protein [Brachybacterium phenoliresistens]|uniref:hypothetical protein n=1 Tax=Brachybacterium phenoliresistens TaxID=396014 RepID=UPI0031D734E5